MKEPDAIVVCINKNSFKCIEFWEYVRAKEYFDQERLKWETIYIAEVRESSKNEIKTKLKNEL